MREQVQLLQLFLEIDEAIRRIDRRFLGINSADDLIRDDEVAIAQKLLTDKLLNKTVSWQSTAAIIYNHRY